MDTLQVMYRNFHQVGLYWLVTILEIDGRGSSLSFRDKRNNTCINNVKKAFNKNISLDYEYTMSFFKKVGVCGIYVNLNLTSYINFTSNLMSWQLTWIYPSAHLQLCWNNLFSVLCVLVCVCLCVCLGLGGEWEWRDFYNQERFELFSLCIPLGKMDFSLLYT